MKPMRLTKIAEQRTGRVPSQWLTHCETQEEKEKEVEYLKNCSTLFDRLRTMLQDKYDQESATKDTDYDCPSWAAKQAHKNGMLQAYEEIFRLLP